MIPQPFRLDPSFQDDPKRFAREVERFRAGESSPTEFRSFRVPMGVYEQRESGTFMLRVRFPAGGLGPEAMRALARVSRRYGSGVLHVTTRQDVQVHRVELDRLVPALEELYAAGLSPRGGGGNTVRNITACERAGVCPEEVFDTSPYAVALSEFLLPDPLSYQLPRKYKIAFAGCARDCNGASVNDLAFFAKRRNGAEGFAVYVGGGLGAKSRVADPLEEFVPAERAHLVAEAVKRVFDRHGNRKNRHRARLRFLIERIGIERFRALYREEREALERDGLAPLGIRPMPRHERPAPAACADTPGPRFEAWHRTCVQPEREAGRVSVRIPLRLGDLPAERMEALAEVVAAHGEGLLRATPSQNLLLRGVHEAELPSLQRKLEALGLGEPLAPVLAEMVSCAGASTCRLGIGLSRGLAEAIAETLAAEGGDLERLGPARLHVSGCPNACGRHPIADLGFSGAARRVGGRLVPHYVVHLGGRVGEGEARLATATETLPARALPRFVLELLEAFDAEGRPGEFASFLAERGEEVVSRIAGRHATVPPIERDPRYYFDWGASEPFSLAGRGPGECGAGVFDLIEVDLATAREAVARGRRFEAAVAAARALLVTRGQQAENDRDALVLFARHFVEAGLVAASWRPLLERAIDAATAPDPEAAFAAELSEVRELVATVQALYDGMDPSLRFPAVEKEKEKEKGGAAPAGEAAHAADREEDLRGVACPLNYVKTKMLLDTLASGTVLAVLLDEEGARNVPESVAKDGHAVLAVERRPEGHFRVVVRKA